MKIKNRKLGFTLVELLVVIAIIAILSVAGLTMFTNASTRSRDARRRTDLRSMQDAMELHYNALNGSVYTVLDGSWFEAQNIPTDPSGGSYTITYSPAGCTNNCKTYSFSAVLENEGTTIEVSNRR